MSYSPRKAAEVRILAEATLLTKRTVYRWLREPQRATRANRTRLESAAKRMGIPLPAGAVA